MIPIVEVLIYYAKTTMYKNKKKMKWSECYDDFEIRKLNPS